MSDAETEGESETAEHGTTTDAGSTEEGFFERSVKGNLSFVGGILGGGIAYGVGLTIMVVVFFPLLQAAAERGDPSEGAASAAAIAYNADESLRRLVSIGAMGFYNAHGVPVLVDGPSGTESVNTLLVFDARFILLALLPAGLLFVIGGLVALVKRADGFVGGIVSGSSVVMGYFPLAIAGALYFQRDGPPVEANVQLLPAIVLAGVLFPLVFGGLAGFSKVLVINVFFGGIRRRL